MNTSLTTAVSLMPRNLSGEQFGMESMLGIRPDRVQDFKDNQEIHKTFRSVFWSDTGDMDTSIKQAFEATMRLRI